MTSNISENIRILRKNSGMTQEQLAKRLFITRQALSNYENGSRLPNLDCFPSSRQLKKQKLFLPPDAKAGGSFYAASIYCSCFSKGVNTPRFLCSRLLL